MAVFTREVDLVWQIKDAENYKFDKLGNCYNMKTNKQLRRTLIGYTEGYCIKGKFRSLKQIRKQLVKIEDVNCPF